jgi:hypothetical protein
VEPTPSAPFRCRLPLKSLTNLPGPWPISASWFGLLRHNVLEVILKVARAPAGVALQAEQQPGRILLAVVVRDVATAGSGWSLSLASFTSHRRALSWPQGAVTFSPHSALAVCASYAPLSACRAWPTTCSRRLGPKVFARPSRSASAGQWDRRAAEEGRRARARGHAGEQGDGDLTSALRGLPPPKRNLFRALDHRPNLREAEVRAEGPRQVQNRRLPPRPSPRLSAVYRSRSRDMHRLRPARSCRICRLRRPQIGRRPGRSVMDARAGGRSGNPSASIISSRGREA